jgi:hypothetical protein
MGGAPAIEAVLLTVSENEHWSNPDLAPLVSSVVQSNPGYEWTNLNYRHTTVFGHGEYLSLF